MATRVRRRAGTVFLVTDLVRPAMSQMPRLVAVIQQAWREWAAVEAEHGEQVAGDPINYLATAILLDGFARRTVMGWDS